jgi:hypothetical protein
MNLIKWKANKDTIEFCLQCEYRKSLIENSIAYAACAEDTYFLNGFGKGKLIEQYEGNFPEWCPLEDVEEEND